ncbi:MAG TPA: PEP-CTERM sorting domain-containing protein [Gemmataceae bacterium]|nr:PEP-CTERM sorting domain-containing protein [Gemmataceae bacterium]
MHGTLKRWIFGLALAAALVVGSRASAGPIGVDYFVDLTLSTDSMAAGINAWAAAHPGANVNMTNDQNNFAAALASGNYNIAVVAIQDNSYYSYPTATSALASFFAGGGKVIVQDWYYPGFDSGFIAPYGATFTGPNDHNAFTVGANPYGLPTGGYSLTNPGWGIYSTDLTPNAGSSVAATFDATGNGAIVYGSTGRSIVNGFLTDTFAGSSQGAALYEAELNSFVQAPAAVPEPASMTLLGIAGFTCAGYFGWRRRKAVKA